MEEYVKISLGESFLLNAGIVGLIRALESYNAEENRDYIINENELLIKKEYICSIDLSDLYIQSMISIFGKDSKYESELKKGETEGKLFENYENLDKDELKKLNDIYKSMKDMLEENSFKSGYVILKNSGVNLINEETAKEFKKEKEPVKKHEKYINLCNALMDKKVREVLIIKELIYSKIGLFYGNVSFSYKSNVKKDINECFNKDFGKPLIQEITKNKKKNHRCIECSKMCAGRRPISFMTDTTDDVVKKKSHYWNMNPDAYVCPICAFVYMFVPLGFHFCGSDAVFINNNSGIKQMYALMENYRNRHDIIGTSKSMFFRIFTTEGIEMLKHNTSNIQVYVRMAKNDHYEMTIINRDIVNKLSKCCKNLEYLEKMKPFKIGNEYVHIYDDVLENILQRKNQYPLIRRQIMLNLNESDKRNVIYIKEILDIEIICEGGENMEAVQKRVTAAFESGKTMRRIVTKDVAEKDKDNSLRGIVYKLENQVSVNNVNLFMDTIIRLYSGESVPIPSVFKECFTSEEMFKAIGQGFILGLKYKKFEKAEEN
ncbi:MAG: hypothetical protein LKJ13_07615 [Clostridia bacterium]|nr:hypothetical protein [Clostridia bacterium]MCI2001244.1 hypothetical protein [Clostridia bacterium]MCI2015950.1 hypothetical protein [Clostridia bacterium]